MSLRWTEEQLEDFKRRRTTATNETIVVVPHPQKISKLERRFSQQLSDNPDITPHQRNYFFLPDRDFELDYAWPSVKVAVEVQGMAHRIKGKFKRDIEKRALALMVGWKVLEVDSSAIRDGRALQWLRTLLRQTSA